MNLASAVMLISHAFSQVPADIEKIPTQPVDGQIRWVYSYAEGKRLAQANFKPMLVVFRCER